MAKFEKEDFIRRLIYFIVGYFASLYGVVKLPGMDSMGLG